ncbi:uncharacterized protein BP01DRAFT_359883 [Aspergillus saccharolyticus JOP 1030-1]|uniref:Uncharacterized protein n=1 Tax=Aspergillus saccharolyticus JOP 1030-1 TaxID=1450539 RepID=A0A318Z495_9EURO|nr:hypothetical protein BP01DRAFT_359883 [Aspergillus saccharolyticus JOP 1030-1]PYH41906.1 hypothetical protein BP01DRAFT_359883 [Aspergillus saccharolyticus JOP 1030-1]
MPINSPKRKRASSEDTDQYSPSSPTSTISILSLQEARLRETEDLGRYSPRAVVAGRLGELAIRGDRLSTPPIPYGLDQNTITQSVQSGCWPALYDSIFGPRKMPESSSLAGDQHDPEESTENTCQLQPDNPETSVSASPRKRQPNSSPRRKKNPSVTSKSRSARSSPPLTGDALENPFTWHDSEITGHNPTDPSDDGYGINGIGFKPTAAIAWARSQKRQKQVAEWKNREAREAREKRRERREGADLNKIRSVQSGAIQKRVKFNM